MQKKHTKINNVQKYSIKEEAIKGKGAKNGKNMMLILVMIIFPVSLILFTLYDNRNYALMSMLFVILSILPFFLKFEMKKMRRCIQMAA